MSSMFSSSTKTFLIVLSIKQFGASWIFFDSFSFLYIFNSQVATAIEVYLVEYFTSVFYPFQISKMPHVVRRFTTFVLFINYDTLFWASMQFCSIAVKLKESGYTLCTLTYLIYKRRTKKASKFKWILQGTRAEENLTQWYGRSDLQKLMLRCTSVFWLRDRIVCMKIPSCDKTKNSKRIPNVFKLHIFQRHKNGQEKPLYSFQMSVTQ